MASRRPIAYLLRASSAATLLPTAAARTSLRSIALASRDSARHYSATGAATARTRIPASRRPGLVSIAASRSTLFGPAHVARYSQDAAAAPPSGAAADDKPSKIWDFEAINKLIQSSKPGAVLIDAREPHELQQTGRIPGAINVPITTAPDSFHISADEFEDRFGYPRPSPATEVVMYCKAGVRSRAAAGLARDAGWTSVGEYPGSWLDWVEKGGKVQH